MAQKVLFQTDLTDVESSDKEGLGTVRYESNGDAYRWIKNYGTTALVADGCCLMKLVTTAADVFKRVLSPNATATGPATCLITMPAGVPVTAIAESGNTNTGDHGWIHVEGVRKVSMRQTATAVQGQAGCHSIATTICVTNSEWGAPATSVIDSTNGGTVNARGVQIVDPAWSLTTGAATVASALVAIHCL